MAKLGENIRLVERRERELCKADQAKRERIEREKHPELKKNRRSKIEVSPIRSVNKF